MIDLAILLAVVGGGAVVVKLLGSRGGDREADEIWTAAARRVGGEVEITTARFLQPVERRIRLTVEEIPVVVHTQRRGSGNSRTEYTRVVAGPLPAASGTRIRCAKRGVVRKLSKVLGLGELPTGHASFDDVVHVSGSPMPIVLAFLDRSTRQLVADSDGGCDLEDATLVVECEGLPAETAPLVAMTRFAERLVQRWCTFARQPARLAEALGLTGTGTASSFGEGTRVVASGIHRSRSIRLSVRVSESIALTVLSFDDSAEGDWTMERSDSEVFTTSGTPPDAVRAFAGVAPASLLGLRSIDGTTELAFEGLGPERDEVRASLDAMIDATTPIDPYR